MSASHLHRPYTWPEAGVNSVHTYEKFRTSNISMNTETRKCCLADVS